MLFRFRYVKAPGLLHTYIRLFAGRSEASLGSCGNLTMRNEEWEQFYTLLSAWSNVAKLAGVKVEFVEEGVNGTVV